MAFNSGKWATSGDPKQGTETSCEVDIINITEEDDPKQETETSSEEDITNITEEDDSEQGTETSGEVDITKITEEEDVEEVSNSSVNKPNMKNGGTNSTRGSVALRMRDQFDRIIEILNRENTATSVPSIGTCLDILKELPGMEYGSETHLIGIRLMKSKSNRETFVLLDDPVLQLKWIKTHTLADLSRR